MCQVAHHAHGEGVVIILSPLYIYSFKSEVLSIRTFLLVLSAPTEQKKRGKVDVMKIKLEYSIPQTHLCF